ncbi:MULTISPECIES: ABC-F family ATP-binding cassette domain-containing protein [Pseudomonas]|uniref:ABC-F family ATP-binding cassette domain-containing protein n=1 Tax=Pseudomonas TaxID=286 RepID=UPI0005AC02B5|nr:MULTISPECIES: ATP-binding cassette domain-containing protein [Pseudomonas]KIQ08968.1 ABC transporter [Pseudomonas simiae]UVM29262.1 ATP-binding cassette domain-containing protein [Pseudomonas sp. B21-021]
MISLKNIELRLGTKVLLQDATVTVNAGEKASLVGRNGTGKSTLFALVCGTLHEEAGEVDLPRQWRIAQVDQHMPETSDSATDFVLQGDTVLMHARVEVERATACDDGMAIAQAYSDLADAGDHDATSRAQSLIQGLGFKLSDLEKPVNSFSGGWRMRLQLARALMSPSDLLLLDEPTNHLDLDALVWLEAWLKKYEGTLLVISHDREFLDAITQVTIHLEHAQLNRYSGNYSAFELLRAQKLEQQQAAHEKQQEKMHHLQKYIDRFRYKATKARQAQSRIKALERIEKISAVVADAEFTFTFKEPDHLPNPMIAIDDADFGYRKSDGGPDRRVLRHVRKTILAGQRIGVLGANGQGKSTFIKSIARDLEPLAGSITEGKGLTVGYFAQQELDVLDPEQTPLNHMLELARKSGQTGQSARDQELRNFLGTFNITADMVTQTVGTLSGGEKARLVLCMIVWQKPNLLLLDEPTNHLDLATREALSLALNQFEGSVMLVSHDRALLRAVCDEFWLVGRGDVTPFEGDLEDYQRYLFDESKRNAEARRGELRVAETHAKTTNQPHVSGSKRLKSIDRELKEVEQRLTRALENKDQAESRLCPMLPYTEVQAIALELQNIGKLIGELEEQWLSLQDEAEELCVRH